MSNTEWKEIMPLKFYKDFMVFQRKMTDYIKQYIVSCWYVITKDEHAHTNTHHMCTHIQYAQNPKYTMHTHTTFWNEWVPTKTHTLAQAQSIYMHTNTYIHTKYKDNSFLIFALCMHDWNSNTLSWKSILKNQSNMNGREGGVRKEGGKERVRWWHLYNVTTVIVLHLVI